MNKHEQKIDKALASYEQFTIVHKHDLNWIYRKLKKWSKNKKISKKYLEDFCGRLVILLEDSIYD